MYNEYMTPADRAACPGDACAALTGMENPPQAACHYPSLAIVYAPMQDFTGLYTPAEGLARGTLFAALDKPLAVGGTR